MEHIRHPDFIPPDGEQRRQYKFSLIQPFIGELPENVIEAFLDIDLFQTDEYGNKIESRYEHELKMGNVDAEIAKIKSPFHS